MLKPDFDWHYLKLAILTAAVTFSLGGALLLFTSDQLLDAEERLQTEQRRVDVLRKRYHKVRHDEQLINTYFVPYQQLEKMRVVGEEHRLNWVDTLRSTVQALQVPQMNFTFSPQQRFNREIIDGSSSLMVFSSQMMIDTSLLHEIDLLRLFDELERQVPNMFHVDSCEIDPIGENVFYAADRPNLNVSCELLWFTIDSGVGAVSTTSRDEA